MCDHEVTAAGWDREGLAPGAVGDATCGGRRPPHRAFIRLTVLPRSPLVAALCCLPQMADGNLYALLEDEGGHVAGGKGDGNRRRDRADQRHRRKQGGRGARG